MTHTVHIGISLLLLVLLSPSALLVYSATPAAAPYIVTFDFYAAATTLAALLQTTTTSITHTNSSATVDCGRSFDVIDRHNPASSLPTDFLLVLFHPHTQSQCQLVIAGSDHVRRVSADRSYRHLLWTTDTDTNTDTGASTNTNNDSDTVEIASHRLKYFEFDSDPMNVGSFALPRRFSTANNILINDNDSDGSSRQWNATPTTPSHSRKLHSTTQSNGGASVSLIYGANKLWERGFTGTGIRVAVFDTGLSATHSHFKRIVERTNWTDNPTMDDELGHGTHVAGVIAGMNSECRGFAPDASLYIFRVFNTRQLSFTAWFLDAFNYALHTGIDVLNLSIGGPDFLDLPFVDKVRELSANGIIVVSAIGNDGPLYGTLNNPADQMDTIGVGGLSNEGGVSSFSSRGMTTHELPSGYGRVKPDVLALANQIMGSKINGGCRAQTGTSVASPVVAGAVALLASTIPANKKSRQFNPARLKQSLIHSAKRLAEPHIFEQGNGKLDLLGAYEWLSGNDNDSGSMSAMPAVVDLTECPYFWPYCAQPLFHSQMPTLVNLTVLNSISVSSQFESIVWRPTPTQSSSNNCPTDLIDVKFEHSAPIWPWSGFLALSITVTRPTATECRFTGAIETLVRSSNGRHSPLTIPLTGRVVPPPPRSRRLLWDQYHNLRYPTGYFPRDNLEIKTDTLDWNGDHPHTNYKQLFNWLMGSGYYLDVLGHDYQCFNASLYATLLVVDSEEEFSLGEITKVKNDILDVGLSVLVFSDWYNVNIMREIKFYDENTASWWTPVTGGCNVPALNQLLEPYQLALSQHTLKGKVNISGDYLYYASGTSIARAPLGARLGFVPLIDAGSGSENRDYAVLALAQLTNDSGRVAVFGDSNCLDENNQHSKLCFHLMKDLLDYTVHRRVSPTLDASLRPALDTDYSDPTVPQLPSRMIGSNIEKFSKVLAQSGQSQCDALYQIKQPRFHRNVTVKTKSQLIERYRRQRTVFSSGSAGAGVSGNASGGGLSYADVAFVDGGSSVDSDSGLTGVTLLALSLALVFVCFLVSCPSLLRARGVSLMRWLDSDSRRFNRADFNRKVIVA